MLHSCPEDVVHMLLEESNQCYVSFILHAGSVHVGWNVWFSAVSTCTMYMYIILLGVLAMKYSGSEMHMYMYVCIWTVL